jgi:hypothetical protein
VLLATSVDIISFPQLNSDKQQIGAGLVSQTKVAVMCAGTDVFFSETAKKHKSSLLNFNLVRPSIIKDANDQSAIIFGPPFTVTCGSRNSLTVK